MESNLSELSSIKDEDLYIQPHYKEAYRLAIYALLCGGIPAYEEFLLAEKISPFLSGEEICFILENAKLPVEEEDSGATGDMEWTCPSAYFPSHSDVEIPELELGWPQFKSKNKDTSISLLFHPPRFNNPTIKEVLRKQIQKARQLIAIVMDVFTDVDIFKEIINATLRGVVVYILLDDSRVSSFFDMSLGMGINILDIKNIRVRTVKGDEYQCRTGLKFHGSMDHRFILLDCQAVIYGTYSYSWSYEKIHRSTVQVITGSLVFSYDEEFRRLYGCSIIPAALSSRSLLSTYPKSSQLSLNEFHMKSRPTPNMRGAMHDGLNNATMLSRGYSMQDRLHQSHLSDTGHSYIGEPQKLNSMNRLRMGTKNLGVPVPSGRTNTPLRLRDVQQPNGESKQLLRHQTRYGLDHNLIPYNSEMSLHKWKMDTYLTEGDMSPDTSSNACSPMISPHGSQMGLNEYQSQQIHSRSMDIKSRMEEERQKRLNMQEFGKIKQSQESLRSLYSTAERPQHMRNVHGRSRGAEMVQTAESTSYLKDSQLYGEAGKTEQIFTDGKRSGSHSNIKMGQDRKPVQNWPNPAPAKTQSDAKPDLKLCDSTLKISNVVSSGIKHFRLMEIPEEKEASNNQSDNFESALRDKNETRSKDEEPFQKSCLVVESNHHDTANESYGLIQNRMDSSLSREENKSNQSGLTEKEHTQQKGSKPQRNSSMGTGIPELTDRDKKVSKKDKSPEQPLSKSHNTLESSQALQKDLPKVSTLERLHKRFKEKPHSQRSRSTTSETEKRTEKPKSPRSKLSSHRLSKRKTTPSSDQDPDSVSAPDKEAASASQTKKERAYSNENIPLDKLGQFARSSDKVKSLSLRRLEEDVRPHQTQGGDNKLGRLMQRMGSLVNKNK